MGNLNSKEQSKDIENKNPYKDIGFIPRKCNTKLPAHYEYLDFYRQCMYNSYQQFYDNINNYDFKDEVIVQDITILEECEVRNIYSLCGILAHKYIWGNQDDPKNTIPQCLAKPWYDSANSLGIPPVLTHAAVDLWNWQLKDPSIGFYLDNLESINTLCEGDEAQKSEQWFYLIMVAIEGECGELVELFEKVMTQFESDNHNLETIHVHMTKIISILTRQKLLMSRMREQCKPELFYNVLRKYLWGSDKVEGGVRLIGVEKVEIENGEPQYLDMMIGYGGGSAAQSSLIQAEDIFFGIKHPKDEFLRRMRDYMPKKHRDYLESMEEHMNMSQFLKHKLIRSSYDYELLMPMYNTCVELIADFRKIHKGVVAEYIIKFMPKDENGTGTGGTPLQSYLKEKVRETEKKLIK